MKTLMRLHGKWRVCVTAAATAKQLQVYKFDIFPTT
jgi:hypothetical protein